MAHGDGFTGEKMAAATKFRWHDNSPCESIFLLKVEKKNCTAQAARKQEIPFMARVNNSIA
jgi:hypothetical protein